MDDMTPAKAKKLVKAALDAAGIPYERLQARTVGMPDLARTSSIFVKPIGMALPDPRVAEAKKALPQGVFLDLPSICLPGTVVR